MNVVLQDAELKVMNLIWKWGDCPASRVAGHLNEQLGWNKNTTYTLIKRCIAKGVLERQDPGFVCHALMSKEEVQQAELEGFVKKLFDGSKELLFASLVSGKDMTAEKRESLMRMIEECGEEK